MLIGHDKVIEDLKCLAKAGNLSHGYIFFGPAMVGKRTLALGLANFLEGRDFSEPTILNDGLYIEPDEKRTIGIDAIRQIKHFLWQKPAVSKRRTVIIDRAELLTAEAQNALLKVTEEPPVSALLILVTSDPDSFAPTLSSRLQKIYFSPVAKDLIAEWIGKKFGILKKSAEDFAAKSFGKPGLAAALVGNKEFQSNLESAENLLKSAEDNRRAFIKALLESEKFSFPEFLDFCIINLAFGKFDREGKIKLWHKLLVLRRDAAYFNLNPRLQLEALFAGESSG